eukprot:SM000062S19915  [mRNA]  locus=s62:336163:336995:+ [translate_table: standard]
MRSTEMAGACASATLLSPPLPQPAAMAHSRWAHQTRRRAQMTKVAAAARTGTGCDGAAVRRVHGNAEDCASVATAGAGAALAPCLMAAAAALTLNAAVLATPALADFKSYDHADMRGRDLSGQDLSRAVFAACDCRGMNLAGSNLEGSTDTFAGFELANLEGTNWQAPAHILAP